MTNINKTFTKKDLLNQISNFQHNNIPKVDELWQGHDKVDELANHKILAFNISPTTLKEPKLSQWEYLDESNLEKLLKLENKKDFTDFIATSSEKIAEGCSKSIFIELIYDVIKFCKKNKFNLEKCGCILSQFYLTHLYFTNSVEVSPEKMYIYFKDLMMCHSLPFPPNSKKIFTIKEAKEVLEFFYRIYLRNLPLIRYLSQPNYALYLNYEIPPQTVLNFKEKKEKKAKKGEKKKGKKK